jgi:hypothetical protein
MISIRNPVQDIEDESCTPEIDETSGDDKVAGHRACFNATIVNKFQ